VSALTDRLSEEDLRELARLLRQTHARAAARRERERQEAEADRDAGGGGHDGAA
jgi:cytochrome c553